MISLSPDDLRQISQLGITPDKIEQDLQRFRTGFPFTRLIRPCTPGDGIKKITAPEEEVFLKKYQTAVSVGRLIKFVPSSGAATRMFSFLQSALNSEGDISLKKINERPNPGQETLQLKQFLEHIGKFPFIYELRNVLEKNGIHFDKETSLDRYRNIIRLLLSEDGLNYAQRPKALILFHRYGSGPRTSFEEHLIEALHTVSDGQRPVHVHFTISPEHREGFDRLTEALLSKFRNHGPDINIRFSCQPASTQTIAVDIHNEPIRDSSGRLVFRPSGHGTLIDNLDHLQADLVFIKNIDNIAPDHLKETSYHYKKLLAGYLLNIESAVHEFLIKLDLESVSINEINECAAWVTAHLNIPPEKLNTGDAEQKRKLLRAILHRPIRVCGMVKNAGEPGGGPFWTMNQSGHPSRQIVEKHQVNIGDASQKMIWESSTHFNPVDLVCSLRDHHGKNHELRRFIDPDTGFISEKFKDGNAIRALEVPGLWNGAMADWLTFFVEVPLITFNPVKTINDLLRPEHQTPEA